MRRVNVVGTSATGKSTMATALAERLGVPCIELDALHWGPNWTEAPDAVFRERVAAAIAGDGWVVDGNYARAGPRLGRPDTVVWLDYPFRTVLGRYLRRTARRIARREELWAGNRERLQTQLFSRDSLLLWILTTYRVRRREYPEQLAAHPQLTAVRLRSPREARRWLADVPSSAQPRCSGAGPLPLAAVGEVLALPDRQPFLDRLDDEPIRLVGLGPMGRRPRR